VHEAFRRGAAVFLMKPLSAAELRRSALSGLALPLARPGSQAPVHWAACVQRAARYIEDHYAEPLCLQTVADAVGMSRYALSRAFKPILNVNFSQYRRLVRVVKARRLLATEPRSVTEIAKAVGYDLAYFDRVFRQETGTSPTKYRKWTRSANGQPPARYRGKAKLD
jgi:AraC-like DNA-binding protein